MNVIIEDKIRRNPIIRRALLPFVYSLHKKNAIRYSRSEDSLYLKSLHNTHLNESVYIVANGPSLSITDLEKLNNHFSIAFNRIFDLFDIIKWRPSVYMSVDKSLLNSLKENGVEPPEADIILINNKKLANNWRKTSNTHEIITFGRTPVHRETLVNKTVSTEVSRYFSPSQSVVYNAFELAFYMGFKKVFLLGADHTFRVEIGMDGKKKINKGVGAHFEQCKLQGDFVSCKEALTKCYETIYRYANDNGIEIYNATRGGALEVFPRVNIDDVI